jgi:hypothetical protein
VLKESYQRHGLDFKYDSHGNRNSAKHIFWNNTTNKYDFKLFSPAGPATADNLDHIIWPRIELIYLNTTCSILITYVRLLWYRDPTTVLSSHMYACYDLEIASSWWHLHRNHRRTFGRISASIVRFKHQTWFCYRRAGRVNWIVRQDCLRKDARLILLCL